MKKIFILFITCCGMIALVWLAATTPLPENFWLWIIGLAGPIVGLLQFIAKTVIRFLADSDKRSRAL